MLADPPNVYDEQYVRNYSKMIGLVTEVEIEFYVESIADEVKPIGKVQRCFSLT